MHCLEEKAQLEVRGQDIVDSVDDDRTKMSFRLNFRQYAQRWWRNHDDADKNTISSG